MLRVDKPRVDAATAARWATEYFGVQATPEPLPGELDRNFLLRGSDGPEAILKVVPAAVPQASIECQVAALDHLAQTAVRSWVPQVRRDAQGRALIPVRDADDAACTLRLVNYLQGTPLAHAARDGAALPYEDIGHRLAQLDLVLDPFDHPGAHRPLLWDVTRVLELEHLLPLVTDAKRDLVQAGLARFRSRALPDLAELPHGVIHNDANDNNLLLEQDGDGWRLSGLIDFGDIVYSATVAELAIAATYLMLDTTDPVAVLQRVRSGYEAARPLQELEARALPELVIGRLCCSVLLSAEARQRAPEDDYLTVSERPAFALLERLLDA